MTKKTHIIDLNSFQMKICLVCDSCDLISNLRTSLRLTKKSYFITQEQSFLRKLCFDCVFCDYEVDPVAILKYHNAWEHS